MVKSTLGAEGTKSKTKFKNLVEDKLQTVLTETVNPRLDHIENFVRSELKTMNERNKNVHGFIVGTVKNEIDTKLHNASITVDAIVEVLAEAGINIENFADKVDKKKLEINEKLKQKAAEEMQKRIDDSIAKAQTENKPAVQPTEASQG